MKAKERYNRLASDRHQFLDTAVECSELTLPYLITDDLTTNPNHKRLKQPWQSVGSKAVVSLASKLVLALLPPQSTFFKFQIRDDKLGEDIPPEVKTDLELSFAKMERMVMEYIAASNDRIILHEAIKHLIVGGNSLVFMSKDGLKNYPLNRYVVDRDGNGNVLEIVTKEIISRKVLGIEPPKPHQQSVVAGKTGSDGDDAEVYTHVRLDSKSGRWVWHQECDDMIIPDSRSTAPKNASPWLVLRFNTVDSEAYGRGRVEEFIGDLKSLEGLSQALVEGAAAASKVIFLVSPSSTTKPKTIADAGSGAIVQGRPEDIAVIQVGKTADFSTAATMVGQLERRIAEAFMQLNIRQSERTTAEEVRLTQLEIEQQLGGIFSLLTVTFLIPYLNRTLLVLQRNKEIPSIPKDLVRPQIVAGINALGRGQDRESLTAFITTIGQTMGADALQSFVNPLEVIKRLAASQGIDILNLVKTEQQLQEEAAAEQQAANEQALTAQAGQLASAPIMDPSKNPNLQENLSIEEPPEE
tara:strand:+ start:7306 stop:8883 length:1578 start_codon:yes stop_codon:yes gene_type:complete